MRTAGSEGSGAQSLSQQLRGQEGGRISQGIPAAPRVRDVGEAGRGKKVEGAG